jgi:hypothetical protein
LALLYKPSQLKSSRGITAEGSSMQLVINTFGSSLRKQGEQFVIQAGEQR